jgi:hypothetical protein
VNPAAPVTAAPRTAAPPSQAGRTARLGEQSLARAALTYLAEPADPALCALLAICESAEVVAAIKADLLPATGPGCGDSPGSQKGVQVVVADVEAARQQLIEHGVQASDVDVHPWGSFVTFSDPDGNTWALQQLPPWR